MSRAPLERLSNPYCAACLEERRQAAHVHIATSGTTWGACQKCGKQIAPPEYQEWMRHPPTLCAACLPSDITPSDLASVLNSLTPRP